MSTNFQGYIIKFGSTEFPHKHLAQKPVFTPCRRLEAEAYRDAAADLHRVTIDNPKSTLTVSLVSGLTLEEKISIEAAMNEGRVNALERRFLITYWCDDFCVSDANNYRTGEFYLKDVSYTYEKITNSTIIYDTIEYTFTEY